MIDKTSEEIIAEISGKPLCEHTREEALALCQDLNFLGTILMAYHNRLSKIFPEEVPND